MLLVDFKNLKLNLIVFLAKIQNGRILINTESHLFKRKTFGNKTFFKAYTLGEFNDLFEKPEQVYQRES